MGLSCQKAPSPGHQSGHCPMSHPVAEYERQCGRLRSLKRCGLKESSSAGSAEHATGHGAHLLRG
eukprot:2177944-Prorocentrum_lima.AAC.1